VREGLDLPFGEEGENGFLKSRVKVTATAMTNITEATARRVELTMSGTLCFACVE